MSNKPALTKEVIEKLILLTDEDIQKLNFHELCLYLDLLEEAEKVLEGGGC